MKIKKIYSAYILLGLLYFISKIIWYAFDWVYLRGLILGLVATVVTILIGIGCLKEYEKIKMHIFHWLAFLGPLFVLIYTPALMIRRLGVPVLQFSPEKLAIFLIFECLAIVQIVLSALMQKERKRHLKGG